MKNSSLFSKTLEFEGQFDLDGQGLRQGQGHRNLKTINEQFDCNGKIQMGQFKSFKLIFCKISDQFELEGHYNSKVVAFTRNYTHF